jgi:DNA adenine methylase
VGSAAVFFDLRERFPGMQALLSDNNEELINCYEAVRDDVEGLIRRLRVHASAHGRGHFYAVRDEDPAGMPAVRRAARMIYLNKTCFNGLWRVNSAGRFNVPMGAYAEPRICQADLLRSASRALRGVRMKAQDFADAVLGARRGTFVYIDPPYDPLSRTAYFTAYTQGGFGPEEQERLARVFRDLDARGCLVMLSNSDTPFIRELYRGFRIESVLARRAINSNGARRGPVREVVVMNYRPGTRGRG